MILNSWNEYKAFVTELTSKKIELFFRGQTDYRWKLSTTFHRSASQVNVSLVDYLDIIIPEVSYYIGSKKNEIINISNPFEFAALLSLLQHHGFPTPLLDWTLSPYIAAYFAYRDINENEPQCDYVKICIFDYKEWMNAYDQPLDLRRVDQYVSVIRPHSKYNERIINQQGIYTVTNVNDIEQYILNCETLAKKKFLYTIELSVYHKLNVMRELNLMGITEMSLFPGLDGICRSLNTKFFSKEVTGLTPGLLDYRKQIQTNKPSVK